MPKPSRRPVVVDLLESRVLLAAAAPAPSLIGNLLSVRGTDSADSIVITVDARRASKFLVTVNGAGYKFSKSAIGSFKVKAGGGDDNVLVDEKGGTIVAPTVLLGGEGNDTIAGASGADVILAWSGNDSVTGGAGNDSITGDDGKDTLTGGTGNDTVQGGNDDDTLVDNDGNTLDGGPGVDTVNGIAENANPKPTGDQPDLQIKNKSDTGYAGDGVYNTTGASQSKSAPVGFYPTLYHLRVQNDGTLADSFLITATAGDSDRWRIRFYDSQATGYDGGVNVSDAVEINGGWNTGSIAPGQSRDFRFEILPQYNSRGGDTKIVAITATSRNNPAKSDVVTASTQWSIERLPEIRRQNFDASGEYLMTVQNYGNVADGFRIKGPSGGTGFSVRYYDAPVGGNDVTAQVISGNGYVTGSVDPTQDVPLRVIINAADGLEHSITLSAASATDGSRIDYATISNRDAKPADPEFFVFGVWAQPFTSFDKWKGRGINTMVMYEGYAATLDEWTNYCVQKGLYMIRQARPNPADDINQPYLLAWAHPDEPEITTKYPPATIQARYDALKAADPNRPVWTNYSGGYVNHWQGNLSQSNYNPFLNATDWASSCIYPVAGWDRPNDLDAPGKAVDRLEKWTQGKPQFAVLETSDQELSWGPKEMPGPTAGQFRAEFWDSIIRGARGIVYFPQKFEPNFSYDNTPQVIVDEMILQQNRVKSIEKAILSPSDPPSLGLTAGGTLEGTWRFYNGKSYFIVLNNSSKATTQSVSFSGTGKASSADVHGESRTVSLTNGSFSDTFAPYETHIYVVG